MKSNVLRFDYWFSFNYKRLRSILGWQLNEDVFHDTYLLGCPVRCSEKQRLKSPVELLI